MALQGLWAMSWLMTVDGHSRDQAAFHLLLTTVAMMCGFLLIALFIGALQRRGVPPDRVLAAGIAAGVAILLCILLGAGRSHVLWFLLGLVFAIGNLSYALLSARFPPSLVGRANTALNLCVFAGAFLIQWGYGVSLDLLTTRGWALADAHRAAVGTLVALQAASFVWFLATGRVRGPGRA
jgi:hypothetical protein